ncbi:30S ribosomal protein S6 [bacterium]|nr:30S ribosomal protein S6 [bacterium]
MLRYETLLLGKTEMTEDDIAMLERSFDKIVSAAQGKLSSFDRWGKYRLAFPVEKNVQGVYMLVRYQIPTSSAATLLKEINTFLKIKCNELVMRHVSVRLKANAPATYNKPEAMDVVRSGSVDAFIKDNKIDSLLSSVDTAEDSSNETVN